MSLTLKGECKWNLNHTAFLKMGERKKHLLKVVHTSLLHRVAGESVHLLCGIATSVSWELKCNTMQYTRGFFYFHCRPKQHLQDERKPPEKEGVRK